MPDQTLVSLRARRPPDAIGKHIGLTSRKCQPAEAAQLLDDTRRERYRQQVPGWRVQNNAAGAAHSFLHTILQTTGRCNGSWLAVVAYAQLLTSVGYLLC